MSWSHKCLPWKNEVKKHKPSSVLLCNEFLGPRSSPWRQGWPRLILMIQTKPAWKNKSTCTWTFSIIIEAVIGPGTPPRRLSSLLTLVRRERGCQGVLVFLPTSLFIFVPSLLGCLCFLFHKVWGEVPVYQDLFSPSCSQFLTTWRLWPQTVPHMSKWNDTDAQMLIPGKSV